MYDNLYINVNFHIIERNSTNRHITNLFQLPTLIAFKNGEKKY